MVREVKEEKMQLGYIIHHVENVAATLDFYEAAFGCTRRFVTPEGDYGELETGATTLAFASFRLIRQGGRNPARPDPDRPTGEVAFVTEDVAAACARATSAGAVLVQAPKEMPWGQTVAHVSDGDGFLVEICTPMGG